MWRIQAAPHSLTSILSSTCTPSGGYRILETGQVLKFLRSGCIHHEKTPRNLTLYEHSTKLPHLTALPWLRRLGLSWLHRRLLPQRVSKQRLFIPLYSTTYSSRGKHNILRAPTQRHATLMERATPQKLCLLSKTRPTHYT